MNRFLNNKTSLTASIAASTQNQRNLLKPKDTATNEVWANKVWKLFTDSHVGTIDIHVNFGFWLASHSALMQSSCQTLLFALLRSKTINKTQSDLINKGIKQGLEQAPCQAINEKQPCSIVDSKLIVDAIPDDWEFKTELATCIYASVETGGRSISVVNITKSDITPLSSGDVKLKYQFAKNKRNWRHELLLSSTSNSAPYLKQLHEQGGFRKIKNEDQLSSLFKVASERCGFPVGYFSYHSLRSGFICSAFVNQGIGQGIIEKTGFIGGW